MSNIIETKDGLVEKSTGRKIVSPLDIIHWSDCAVYNEPAYPAEPCDCGAAKAYKKWWTYLYHLFGIRVSAWRMSLGTKTARLCCRLSSISNPALCQKNYPRKLDNNGVLRFW